MGCCDRYGDATPEERAKEERERQARVIILNLRKLPASTFTVDELMLIMQIGISPYKTVLYTHELVVLEAMKEKYL